ncbi:radical SAM/SPASM domain-containing protein [Desulfovibrio sp. TomC]|uniref:radical SAM/SPASM domain-containing protein n=1 Tax=Desulfovibrio sp. TomC TaxID=1562888 RepID=UPI0005758CFD|nr:SPASM domain-containing protein [Desulfovibrio sp. TomC]KHK01454.1 Radical SAM domain protein [Desulfovibrio sp. TomC]
MSAPLVLDHLLIEASSRSRAEVGYTIRAGHKRRWLDHDLPAAVFEKMLREIVAVTEIRFHGWGDSLANPDILTMLTLAKHRGARTVLVTDGSRLDDEQATALVRDDIDAVVFPLAGLTEDTNFRRRGTSLYAVLAAIDRLATVKAVHQSSLPEIRVRYTLTSSGLDTELAALPRFLADIGATAASIRPLSYATGPETEYDTLVPTDQDAFDAVAARLRATAKAANELGIRLDSRLVHGGQTRFRCPDKPSASLFIAADGAVSPCALRNVPIADPAGYRFHGHTVPFPRDVRGNLHNTPLAAIWNDPDYREFRYCHDTDTPPGGCAGCWRSFWVDVE